MLHDFPVDLPDAPPPDRHALGWTGSIIAITALGLLLTNAVSIADWGAEMTPSPGVVRFVNIADRWHAFTGRTGLGAPRKGVHAVWKKLEAARFPGQEAAREAKPAG
jgi:hypothetical protein